jgi:uracil-DNA glycosylase
MNEPDLASEIEQITNNLIKSPYGSFIDGRFTAPVPFRGTGDIKIIILGQDPTVKNPEYRKKIKVTLLLDQAGGLRTYLGNICSGLGINLDKNIYATNLLKNFFAKPPDQIRKENSDFMQLVSAYWIPLLIKEISEFPNIPVLTLGEPVLNCLLKTSDWVLIRNYWGYKGPALYDEKFYFISSEENVLNRNIFPFPHIHGKKHKFYLSQIGGYLKFTRRMTNQFILAERPNE